MMTEASATVVIPSFNRPERLRQCLEALMDDPAGGFDVIVVDDGSPMPLAPTCADFGPRVRCIRQHNRGPAAARNRGVAESTGRIILFTDDDCRPYPGWVAAMVAAQGGEASRLVGGRVVNLLESNCYAAASQALCDFLYEHFGAERGEMPFFTSNNLACDRAWFSSIGGFDESFPLAAAEDREFGLRWRGAGGTLAYAPDAVVGHAHALALRSFLRQHSNYGRGAWHLHRVLERRGHSRPRLEQLRFYGDLVSYPVQRGGHRAFVQSVLLFLSQVAMISGYVRQSRSPCGQRAGSDA